MGIVFDIAGVLIVRSAIITIMLTVTVSLNDVLYFKTAYRSVQGDLSSTVEVVQSDLLKIGYNVTGGNIFVAYDTSYVSFLADVDDNGSQDTVTYSVSDPSALSSTPNPNDRLLYRAVSSQNGGQPLIVGSGLTKFFIRYYAANGSETTDPLLITSVHIDVRCGHATYVYNDVYPEVQWQRRIFPTNL